jgi:hypothetical protein
MLMNLQATGEAVNAGWRPGAAGLIPGRTLDLARQRFSCRRYRSESLTTAQRTALAAELAAFRAGPFGAQVRLRLLASTPSDPEVLRGLGTYGFIRGATAFIVGAVGRGQRDLEDFGHTMERAILAATGLGLGTCWLGGSFTRSRFARAVEARADEIVPAVAAVGAADPGSERGMLRAAMGARVRLPWERLFFEGDFSAPLAAERAGPLGPALEAVRLAPSASNKQPWRVLRQGSAWHFYLARTPGYGRGSLTFRLLGLADLQRVDVGIAMSHFELAASEAGCPGRWTARAESAPAAPGLEHLASWLPVSGGMEEGR